MSLVNGCGYLIALFFLPAIGGGATLFKILFTEFTIFVLLAFVYLIRMLLWFKEAMAVIVAYTIFTCLLAISIFYTAFPGWLRPSYQDSVGTLTEVVGVLIAFRSFKVTSPVISMPFKLFGAGVGLITIPKLIMMLVAKSNDAQLLQILNNLGLLVMLAALCMVLKKTINYLKNTFEPEPEILTEDE